MAAVVYEFEKIDFHKRNRYIFQFVENRTLTDVCHSHDFYELIWFVRGGGLQRINSAERICETDSVFLLRPQDEHCFLSQSADAAVVSLSVEKTEFELFSGLYHPQLPEVIVKEEHPVCYRFMYPSLISLCKMGRDASQFDCKFLLSCLLKSYIDQADCLNEPPEAPCMLMKAAEEMKRAENLWEGISAFVRVSHYSQSHLSRLIRKHYHMSLKQYINELRLQNAYCDILQTDRPIQEIAEGLGYASFSHFNKIFRERFASTPATLRKQKGMRTI